MPAIVIQTPLIRVLNLTMAQLSLEDDDIIRHGEEVSL
jgi:hypothetical protein